MGRQQVDPERKTKPPAPDRPEDDIMEKKDRHVQVVSAKLGKIVGLTDNPGTEKMITFTHY
jgi:hypothetical protein